MSQLDNRMIAAWREATADLGIRLVTPFKGVDESGLPAEFEGFLPDFGSASGIVFVSFSRDIRPNKAGPYGSVLYDVYREYDRTRFIEALNDWGWFGKPAEAPAWYTGQAWSEPVLH